MKPTLVVLAAGMGSRYGGLKQMDPVGAHGELIIDYSLFDARRAGFKRVCFIIKHEIEADFKAMIGNRIEKYFEVSYAFQQLDCLPEGCAVPEGRVKPGGTAHAVLCAAPYLDAPFAAINADLNQAMMDVLAGVASGTMTAADGAAHLQEVSVDSRS